MRGHGLLHARGLGALIAVVAILAGAGAIGNSTPASPPPTPGAPTALGSSARPDVAAEAPSGVAPTTSASSPRPVLVSGEPPAIAGEARYGSELRIAESSWQPSGVTVTYRWLRDGVPIPEAGTRRYRITADDIGHRLSVRVTGSRTGFETVVQETRAVGPVVGQRLSTAIPWVSGWAGVGGVLTAGVGAWGPGTVRLSWQWYRDAERIDGAIGTTYELVAADLGHTVKVRVRGSAKLFEPQGRFSAPTSPVEPGVLRPTPVPVYSGIAQVGRTLTALPRYWGPGEVSLTFQWFRSGSRGETPIEGATGARYTLVDADAGHRLKVRVTGRKPGYTEVQRYSAWTSVVAPGIPAAAGAASERR